jgi:hypothetical protein
MTDGVRAFAKSIARLGVKILAGIMLIGSLGGIVSNLRYFQQDGFEGVNSGYALVGLVFEFFLFAGCVYLLRRHILIHLVALALACIATASGLLVVTDQGSANADLDNSFVAHGNYPLDWVFSRPLPNAGPYFEPRMLSWRRLVRGWPVPWLVKDVSLDGAYYYARLEGAAAVEIVILFSVPCWLLVSSVSRLVRQLRNRATFQSPSCAVRRGLDC